MSREVEGGTYSLDGCYDRTDTLEILTSNLSLM